MIMTWALFVWVCVLQVMDVFTTYYILTHGGRELNPLGAWLWKKHRLFGLIVMKLTVLMFIFGVLLGAMIGATPQLFWDGAVSMLFWVLMFYSAICVWNGANIVKRNRSVRELRHFDGGA